MSSLIDLSSKRDRLVHDGGFLKFEVKVWLVQPKFHKTLVTRYSLPHHKVSNQFKSYNGVLMYPPLWTSRLVALHDDIVNKSITAENGQPWSIEMF